MGSIGEGVEERKGRRMWWKKKKKKKRIMMMMMKMNEEVVRTEWVDEDYEWEEGKRRKWG